MPLQEYARPIDIKRWPAAAGLACLVFSAIILWANSACTLYRNIGITHQDNFEDYISRVQCCVSGVSFNNITMRDLGAKPVGRALT